MNMLKIKPITKLVDGSIILYDKHRGRKRALSALLNEIAMERELVDSSRIFITHSFAPEAAVYLKEELESTFGMINIIQVMRWN